MKLPSTSETAPVRATAAGRDAVLARFVQSIVHAARDSWGDRLVAEGSGGDPRQLYTETHYALAAILLYARDRQDPAMLDLAESRLRLWATGTYPLTFFNAMAICLAAVVFRRSGASHPGVQSILDDLIGRTREHRHVAYPQWCGNNAYLQQVAVDTVLLPVVRGQKVTEDNLRLLLAEFRSFRTEEGLFFDLPRSGTLQERLSPPTYIMKMLFLLGICHELHPSEELALLFRAGMATALPLLSRDGHFSYFGRTDNSPFGVGLTIFNLRKATRLTPASGSDFDDACARAERFYLTFPRTASGMLESNRFADPASATEVRYSKDDYAYVGQYSLASGAYALLGCHWFPAPDTPVRSTDDPDPKAAVAVSRDLGVVKLDGPRRELVVRTRSEMTSWDRRYLGPTILRYAVNDRLLVGAISRTVATDRKAQPNRPASRARKFVDRLRRSYVNGAEQLDATSVGFLPVLRAGAVDYVPYAPVALHAFPSRVTTRHQMLRVNARGLHPCFIEAIEFAHFTLPGLRPKRYTRPRMMAAPAIELARDVVLDPAFCSIEDHITGDVEGKELLFSVRHLPSATVRVDGLAKVSSMTGWGSDGRQTLDLYSARPTGSEIRYRCEIAENT